MPHARSDDLRAALERALAAGSRTASELCTLLEVSQPTLSRTIQTHSAVTSYRIRGDRTPRYAMVRSLPLGLEARQRVYRVLSSGSIVPFADLEFLKGGATLERLAGDASTTLYDGLPPYISFSAPSGFLGRQLAREVAALNVFPQSLTDWSDDHRVAYLFTRGLNLPGNLIFGNASLQLEMELLQADAPGDATKAAAYVQMASALKSAGYGSSAGGEQPKFLWLSERHGHVIVKFAKSGSRMADLLPLEHLALRELGAVGVPASTTHLLAADEYVFLEVQRFDRVGLRGRVGLLSAGAVDDEYFRKRDNWSDFAARCVSAGYLAAQDARRINIMAAFSELIGNGDRHFENISVLINEDGEYAGVAPAYDILPMRYASIGAGVDPDLTPVQPKVGPIGADPDVWGPAAVAALRFWRAAESEVLPVPVSGAMRQLAAKNHQAVERFVAPLVPAGLAP